MLDTWQDEGVEVTPLLVIVHDDKVEEVSVTVDGKVTVITAF